MNLMLLYVGLVLRNVTLLLCYVNWQFGFVHLSLRNVGLLFAYAGLILYYLIYSLHFITKTHLFKYIENFTSKN